MVAKHKKVLTQKSKALGEALATLMGAAVFEEEGDLACGGNRVGCSASPHEPLERVPGPPKKRNLYCGNSPVVLI